MFLRNSRFQNTLTAAAGGGGLITQTILGNGRIRRINNADGRCVRVSATGASIRGIGTVFRNHDKAMSQFGYCIVLIAVAAGARVKGIAILRAGGSHYGFCIAVGMVCVSISATGAGIGFQTTFHIVVPQSRSFIRSVALATSAFVEGVAALVAGGCDYRGDIIVNRNRLIGLGDHSLTCPIPIQIVGVINGGIRIAYAGRGCCQLPPVLPGEVPAGIAIEIADGVAAYNASRNSVGSTVIGCLLYTSPSPRDA